MAVFTQVAIEELNHFLSQYNIGELYGYEEIKEGRENTNYVLLTYPRIVSFASIQPMVIWYMKKGI